MDSPQSVVSPLKSSSIFPEFDKQNPTLSVVHSYSQSAAINFPGKKSSIINSENTNRAFLEVYIHQARNIHNICIYQNQDVYAKLCLTSDPEHTISTKIINGGGQNPVFNENLRLDVHKIDSSLKCEIWMMSRVKNYLEDQLLGFALVPISEILLQNGMLEKEFSLSSTDLVHSPAGFVQLSASYVGDPPEVIPIPSPSADDMESSEDLPCDLDKIEFPDPKIANENRQMVEEYIAMPCPKLDSQTSYSLVSSDTENLISSEANVLKTEDSDPSSLSTTEISSASPPVTSPSCETPKESKFTNEDHISSPKSTLEGKRGNDINTDTNSPVGLASNTINIVVPEPNLVQQDFVNMYMKSMQQFTDSLAKMKLPGDLANRPTTSSNSSSDQKSSESKNSGSRVFYGSRAFF